MEGPSKTLLEPAGLDALCEALLPRLLPALHAMVEQATARALQSIQSMNSGSAPGATLLGTMPPGRAVTVDWTFTNTGQEVWPAGSRLRHLGGSLAPQPGEPPARSQAGTPSGSRLTLQAAMTSPSEPGPCEAQWQLESADGMPLCPVMLVRGAVVAVTAATSAAQVAALRPTADAASLRQPAAAGEQSQPTAQSAADRWLQLFETTFGNEVAVLAQRPGGREQVSGRMVNQVWEYTRQRGLLRPQDNAVIFDAMLMQLFSPVLQGASSCSSSDLLPLIHKIMGRYLEWRGSA
ncbi:unnamed protein product [Polarella glacialis]|uniref:Nbr1 FW domain-containing protein n=1 Tax=Polarella glacialis TaxID=89957 RepID=A0A813HFX2_POLGL|nr:unnamed protein product [Polarella glacialis]